jgi:P-type Ca2+ transporter type 2C
MIHGSAPAGLSATEAAARLAADGPNELPHHGQRSRLRIIADVLKEPMLALLLGAGVIYMALGDATEALVLLGFACLSIIITVAQEARAERALDALRDLTSPRALVIRDGQHRRIPGREVVRGDLVLLGEGDRVPADGMLIEGQALSADESLLTGESVPVAKTVATGDAPTAMARPGGDGLPFLFSGSLVVAGSGTIRVLAIGAGSEIGRIGRELQSIETEAPRLFRQTRRLVWWMALVGGAATLACILLYGLLRGDWLEAALAGIALGMSMLPEEFPVVLTVFMAMGALRMSRVNVLTRRAAAIETLGAATVLCTDKTGTLTENRMRIAQLRLPDGQQAEADAATAGDDFARLAALGLLASAQRPVDPMEQAFHDLAQGTAALGALRPPGWALQRLYPFSPDLLAMTQIWGAEAGGDWLAAAKGAPEAIGALCRLDDGAMAELKAAVDSMAGSGLRVLGVAQARWPAGAPLPGAMTGLDFSFAGLVGLADPLRASVPDAVRQCREAGIRVVMITGDYPQTARAIAAQAGIEGDRLLTGTELAAMDDAELARALPGVTVFARIMPEQKLRLVNALKAGGAVVAMTGDGVNDAPSLKAAHIGIAMGGRGTDVAREASSLVLLDDDFGSIVAAVRLGRRINDNLRKAMGFIVAVHIPIAGLALLPLLMGMPMLLGPIHIAFIEMIIDPVCSLAFEAETDEPNLMQRPPRAPDAPLFSRALLGWAVLQGVLTMAAIVGLALWLWQQGLPDTQVRTAAFIALVLGALGLVLINRSFNASLADALLRPNLPLAIVAGVVAAILAATQLIPPIARLFDFTALNMALLLPILGGSAAMMAALEAIKPTWRRWLTA